MLRIKIVTPNGIIYDNDVDQVTVPTASGQITVLPHHIPLVSVLQAGELLVKKQNEEIPMAVSGGVIEVRPNSEMYIMADTAERAEHIDIERAEAARLRAEELIQREQFTDDLEFARIQAKIEKEVARVRVGQRYRKLRNING